MSIFSSFCGLQAAYKAIQAFQQSFPSAGEDAARLKEEVYALLEERAQHAQQRRLRLVQKKRTREEARAQARRQGPFEADTAGLATVSHLKLLTVITAWLSHFSMTPSFQLLGSGHMLFTWLMTIENS